MRPIWPILLVFACKDREAAKSAEPPAPPAAAGHADPARPVLPATPDDKPAAPAPTAIADAFASESIDGAWRTGAERDIRARVPAAGDVECHHTLCRITITGSEAQIAAAIDQMENQASLRGIAASVLLTAPEKQVDGKLALRAYARFDRPDPD